MAAAAPAMVVLQPCYVRERERDVFSVQTTSAQIIKGQRKISVSDSPGKDGQYYKLQHHIAINHTVSPTQCSLGLHLMPPSAPESCRAIGVSTKEAAVQLVATFLVSTAVLSTMPLDIANASDMLKAQGIFQRSCVGCHVGGGNILQPGATLTAPDLQRNGLSTVEDIFKITYSGKGRMPGFGELCAPRGQCTFGSRLSDEDIRSLAEFVRLQADQGWKASE